MASIKIAIMSLVLFFVSSAIRAQDPLAATVNEVKSHLSNIRQEAEAFLNHDYKRVTIELDKEKLLRKIMSEKVEHLTKRLTGVMSMSLEFKVRKKLQRQKEEASALLIGNDMAALEIASKAYLIERQEKLITETTQNLLNIAKFGSNAFYTKLAYKNKNEFALILTRLKKIDVDS